MKDPRREEYRAECAATARRGVIRLQWPKQSSLFVSNLNDNVNEQLLREELSTCGPVLSINIPMLHARSLGLAYVELQVGVKPDRFIKEFHGRELLGQQMNVVIDQEGSKFRQALKIAKSPKKMDTVKEVPQPSPKKRARTSESPNYSPASPARPVSDCDGPSPSKPKRPRCSSPMPSPHRHEVTFPARGNKHDTYRSHGEQQFFQHRRDSYRSHPPYHRNYSRSFVNESSRDYRARYQEGRDDGRYGHRSSFNDRNRFHPGGSRRPRHESFGDHSSYPHMRKDRYDDYGRQDRRNSSGYVDRHRAPPHPYGSGYGRDYSGRHDNDIASGPSNMNEIFPCDPKQEQVWLDETRPAISLKRVPYGTASEDLLDAFRRFRPRGAINNIRGNWTMWFDESSDRNDAASDGYLMFHNHILEVKHRMHVIGRKSTSARNPDRSRRDEEHSRHFEKRNTVGAERPVADAFGPIKNRHSEEQYSRRYGRTESHRNGSRLDHRSSGHPHTYRGVDNRVRSRTDTRYHAPDSGRERTPGQHSSTGDRYNRKEWRPEEEKKRADRDSYPKRGGRDVQHRKREASLDEHTRTRKVSSDVAAPGVGSTATEDRARTRISDAHENVRKGDVEKTLSPNRTPKESRADPTLSTAPTETSKNATLDDFADIIAQHVYRTARDAIAVKGFLVQKSLVAQTVVKFLKSRQERERHEKERAKQAALAKQKAEKNAAEKQGAAAFSSSKTAHLDIEEFLIPTKSKQRKPPLPSRQAETPSKKRPRRSRFAEIPGTDSEQEVKPSSSVYESEGPNSPEQHQGIPIPKRRRVVLSSSPRSPDPGNASPDGNRQNSVESVASSEFFRANGLNLGRKGDETKKDEESVAPHDTILSIEKPQIRLSKGSSLKLSSPSTGEGSIPHLVLSTRPPPSPATCGPVGSAFTTSEDSTSHRPSKPTGITKKSASRKTKTGAKPKKKGSRGLVRLSKKQNECTTDDEQYAGVLLSLNDKLKPSRAGDVELVVSENGFIDFSRDEYVEEKKTAEPAKVKDPPPVKCDDDGNDDPVECEPPERVGKCARTDVYVRAEHVGQHRKRNVHSRTSTSTQSSRQCRQESRVYRKGVSQINPKNDILTLNHLKQRRKKVSFGQSRIHGMGLYAKESIEAGEFIIEYVGDLIRRVVADLREKKYVRQGMGDSYLFRLSDKWVIDATRQGGIARYINHSCDPNVIARIISVDGEPKIVFYSKRSIKEGEELTYDYKFDFEAEDQKIPCLCQAPSCRKYLN